MLNNQSKSGPKTVAGKKRSAQNAIKSGLYSAQLLAGESMGAYAAVRSALVEEYEAYDALALSAVEELAITTLRRNRVFAAEAKYMAGIMQTEDARKAVALKLYGSEGHSRVIPWWFLDTGESDEKSKAMRVYAALVQLDELKAVGVKQGIQALKEACPEAYWLVMGYRREDEQFWQVLARVTQRNNVIDCVDAFKTKVKTDYERYIDWAKNHRRYQAVVNLVYAEFKMQMMAKPEMIKLLNSLNRQTEHALSVLHARDQMLGDASEQLTISASNECDPGTVVVVHGSDKAKTEDVKATAQPAASSIEAVALTSSAQVVPTAPSNETVVAGSSDAVGADIIEGALTLEAAQEASHSNEVTVSKARPSKSSKKGANTTQGK